MEKKCIKCDESKPLTDFYKHSLMADGHINKCKACSKSESKIRDKEKRMDSNFVETEKIRAREKYYRLDYRSSQKQNTEKKREALKRHVLKFPEKKKARQMTQHILKANIKNELHHWSYNKEHWKDVIELSVNDHAKLHRYLVYDPERLMYRRCDNNILLDTKLAHVEYFNETKNKL